MYKYLSSIALICTCLTASATSINWGQYAGTVNFTNGGDGWQYATFENAAGSGVNVRLNVFGSGFTGAKVEAAHYGYTSPAYGNGAPNLGLVFNSSFANKGDSYSVWFDFYTVVDGQEVTLGTDSLSLSILGIGVGNGYWQGGAGSQDHRDAISNIYGTSNYETVNGLNITAGKDINNASNAAPITAEMREYAFQNGVYYGTGPDWGSDYYVDGNISVAYNEKIETVGFTFSASTADDASVKNNGLYKQSFAIGNFTFGDTYAISGTQVPEPSTYALLLGLGVAAVVVIRRRKA